MELPAGSAAKHSAGLVVEQAPDPAFRVQFNTHNVNAHITEPTASRNAIEEEGKPSLVSKTEPAASSKRPPEVAHITEPATSSNRLSEVYNKPWFENRDGEWFCTMCGKWATPEHIANKKHLDRAEVTQADVHVVPSISNSPRNG